MLGAILGGVATLGKAAASITGGAVGATAVVAHQATKAADEVVTIGGLGDSFIGGFTKSLHGMTEIGLAATESSANPMSLGNNCLGRSSSVFPGLGVETLAAIKQLGAGIGNRQPVADIAVVEQGASKVAATAFDCDHNDITVPQVCKVSGGALSFAL